MVEINPRQPVERIVQVATENGQKIVSIDTSFRPTWLVAANRIIQMGKASRYATTLKAAIIDLRTESGQVFAHKFPDLKDMVSVIVLYKGGSQ